MGVTLWPVGEYAGPDADEVEVPGEYREFDADGNEMNIGKFADDYMDAEDRSLVPTAFAFQKKDNGNLVMLLLNPDADSVTYATYRTSNSKVTIENVSKERGNELFKLHKNNSDFEPCDDTKAIVLIKRELRGFTYD